MGYGIDPELLKVVAAIITSIVGPDIGFLIFLIKRSMEKGQSEIKNELHNLSVNVNQLSQILKVNVNVHFYQPPERIEKLEEMKEGVKSLKEPITKVEEVEVEEE